jgi:hypothetical protein
MDQPHSEPHRQAHEHADDPARWMTFAELATIRGTSKRAAITLIRRHGWRRQRDNQNRVIALVPLTWAVTEPAGQAHGEAHRETHTAPHNEPTGQAHAAAFETALAAIREAKDSEIATLHGVIEGLRSSISRAEDRAARAEVAAGGERAKADALRDDLSLVRAALDQTQAEARDALRRAEAVERADADRKARGLVARLRAAWRGK